MQNTALTKNWMTTLRINLSYKNEYYHYYLKLKNVIEYQDIFVKSVKYNQIPMT